MGVTRSIRNSSSSSSSSSNSVTMPPFHSTLPSPGRTLGNMALMPLRQTTKGSARGPAPSTNDEDIVDQTINLFKANILFKQFEMETDVDRVLVYVTLYIIECLKRLQKMQNVERATQDMYSAALESFAIPGEAGFPLNAFYTKPQGGDTEEMKKYFVQLRHETGARLAEKVFDPSLSPDGGPAKWWTCWAKRKFLNVALDSRR